MPKFILDYIWLCRNCSLDLRTVGNMRSIVIPALQERAANMRAVIATAPDCYADFEGELHLLESAAKAGLRRCASQPEQQQLFAA
ncbi:hypothetical protein [Pseudomonas sp.]|uniref:hypothetical protein n=1 Tax=Pseudomonas sp. TaxID=306 RepID=UPI0028A9A5E4|nr:hypothetical protein [Pseudomonas sp.]